MWFNEDEEEEGEAVVPPVEKSKQEDDFPDSYEKFMETKKGIYSVSLCQHWKCSVPHNVEYRVNKPVACALYKQE